MSENPEYTADKDNLVKAYEEAIPREYGDEVLRIFQRIVRERQDLDAIEILNLALKEAYPEAVAREQASLHRPVTSDGTPEAAPVQDAAVTGYRKRYRGRVIRNIVRAYVERRPQLRSIVRACDMRLLRHPPLPSTYRNSIADDALNKILAKEQSPSVSQDSIANTWNKILAKSHSIPETEESGSN
ncbi:MAG: hypothetical protein WCV62_04225 [Candidatus Peribacteraceae bacterium]|jgi:hypothetical protein